MATDSGGGSTGVSNQLSSLVPGFDPAVDDMLVYQQKVELVLAAWPPTKLKELVTRLILNTKRDGLPETADTSDRITLRRRSFSSQTGRTVGWPVGKNPAGASI